MQEISDFIRDLGAGKANITVSTNVYNLEAIQAASYEFTDGYHILITSNSENSVTVIFEAKDKVRDFNKDLKSFANALIDHQLRYQLDKTNGKIRNLIVAHAFSSLNLQEETDSL